MKSAKNRLIQLCLIATLSLSLSLSSSIIFAQPVGDQGEQRKPPKKAIEACKSLSAAQVRSISFSHRTLSES